MTTAVFLQARLNSKRLPNKVLLPLADKALLVHAMEALKGIPADVYAVLTDEDSVAELEPMCKTVGFSLFAGDSSDVLKRYADASARYPTNYIIRATGDNPVVSNEIAIESLRLAQRNSSDYAGLLQPPYGTAVEVIASEALRRADADATTRFDREHVTAFIYKNPRQFRIHLEDAPEAWRSDACLTVDTPEDYWYVQNLYSALYRGSPIAIEDAVRWCSQNPRSGLMVS